MARFNTSGLLLVYDIRFDPGSTIGIGDSWTATLSGPNLTDETYFDLRFRSPGNNTDQVALNWQRGTTERHSILAGTTAGTWIITGVRPHLDISDHDGEFIPVSVTLTVSDQYTSNSRRHFDPHPTLSQWERVLLMSAYGTSITGACQNAAFCAGGF